MAPGQHPAPTTPAQPKVRDQPFSHLHPSRAGPGPQIPVWDGCSPGLCRSLARPRGRRSALSRSGKDTVSSRALAITRFSIICRCRDSVCEAGEALGTPARGQQRGRRGAPGTAGTLCPALPPQPAAPLGVPTCQGGLLQSLAGVQPRHPRLVGSLQLLVLQRRLLQRCQLPAGPSPQHPPPGAVTAPRDPSPGPRAGVGPTPAPLHGRAHVLARTLRLGDLQLLEDLWGQEG